MAPSRSALDRERHLSKHYNLRLSPLKLKSFLLSSRPFSCTDNDNESLRVEVKITHEEVAKAKARLSDCTNERLPEHFHNHLAPFTTAEVKELCNGPGTIIPGRFYICPTCPAYVRKPPVEIPLLHEVVDNITGAHRADIERTERRVPADPAAQWEGMPIFLSPCRFKPTVPKFGVSKISPAEFVVLHFSDRNHCTCLCVTVCEGDVVVYHSILAINDNNDSPGLKVEDLVFYMTGCQKCANYYHSWSIWESLDILHTVNCHQHVALFYILLVKSDSLIVTGTAGIVRNVIKAKQ
ncbi:uncharacterized protein HD556DRAFT_1313238 [Suillus plorans]|uniref:Uncharacterized protein n=1 Tax=Suillus plorans TaxID=116603 RepID=A0A9P7AEN4_9AGAM|nr:uncharacterized protein HD556DRAFT_1313238 [Suillus plorans]KAG1786745.1 hypothetical protein HD556DRAFT_1313238 [Suillus plorans]